MIVPLVLTFAGLLVVGAPMAVAMALSATVAFLIQGSTSLKLVVQTIYAGMDSFLFLAVPLFILAGNLMEIGGITRRLVALAHALVGHFWGGLGMVTVVGEILFSEISGSTTADVSAIGSIMTPALTHSGYAPGRAVAIVSASAGMGILVPPCITMLVLASIANLSVAALFMAGFLPAFTMAALIMVLIGMQAKRENIPRQGRFSWKRLGATLLDALIALGMPVIIFGGILGGVFTATEAAAVAVVYGLLVGVFVYKEIQPRQLIRIFAHSAVLTATVGFLVGAAGIFAFILASEKIPQAVAQAILSVSRNPTFFMVVSLIVFLSIGLILEGLPAVIVLFPIMQPVSRQVGIDPLHYAIVATAAIGVGIFIPPLGVGYLIACGIGRVRASDAIRPMLPYVVVLILGLLIVALVPGIALVLPRFLGLY